MKQATLDRIRRMNKRFTNKLLIHFCGKKFGHFAILSHTGRKSGTIYRIPIIAEPVESGFVIALTYGRKVDWAANVIAKGGCSLYWKQHEYPLVHPEWLEMEVGLTHFPAIFRAGLKKMGIRDFLQLQIMDQSE